MSDKASPVKNMSYWNGKNDPASALKSAYSYNSPAKAGLVAAASGAEKVAKSAENIKKSVGNITGSNQLKKAMDAPISKDASGTKTD